MVAVSLAGALTTEEAEVLVTAAEELDMVEGVVEPDTAEVLTASLWRWQLDGLWRGNIYVFLFVNTA